MLGGWKKLSWRSRTVAFISVLLLLAVVISWFSQPSDPRFKGKRFSAYLYAAHAPIVSAPNATSKELARAQAVLGQRNEERRRALRALGPRALPLLMNWLEETEPRWRKLVRRQLFQRRINWPAFTAPPRRDIARQGLWEVREHAAPAAPALIKRVMNGHAWDQQQTAMVLRAIFDAAPDADQKRMATELEPLIELIITRAELKVPFHAYVNDLVGAFYARRLPEEKEAAMLRLMRLPNRSEFESAIRILDPDAVLRNLAALQLPSHEPSGYRAGAALFFRDKPIMPEKIVPLLIDALASSNRAVLERAAQALGAYGADAVPALPLLSNLTSLRDHMYRMGRAKHSSALQRHERWQRRINPATAFARVTSLIAP